MTSEDDSLREQKQRHLTFSLILLNVTSALALLEAFRRRQALRESRQAGFQYSFATGFVLLTLE